MKIFISWSGQPSQNVAKELSEWLPCVLQNVETFVSSEDIQKGSSWLGELNLALESSALGIVILTKENIYAPWINFEAGAISNAIGKKKLCPVLFDINRFEIEGPLSQFQSTMLEKEDVKSLLHTINEELADAGISSEILDKSFSAFWPALDERISSINPADSSAQPSIVEVNEALNRITKSIQSIEKAGEWRSLLGASIGMSVKEHEALPNLIHSMGSHVTVIKGYAEALMYTEGDIKAEFLYKPMRHVLEQTEKLEEIIMTVRALEISEK